MSELLDGIEGVTDRVVLTASQQQEVWFPRHISEVQKCCTTLFKYGAELSEDHPGYGDGEYVKRRREIAETAKSYV